MPVFPDFQLGIWVSVLDFEYEAETVGYFGAGRIPSVILPMLLDEPFLRFQVSSSTAKASWQQGLRVFQVVDSFLGANDVISQHLILLNEPQIIEFIDYPDGYRLKLNFFSWFSVCRVKIDKFVY
jgi:hypothetical protein